MEVVAGDFFADPLPDGHDAVLIANVVHLLSPEHNLELLRNLDRIVAAGRPVLLGVSRKSFIGRVLDVGIEDRLEGSLAAATLAALSGVHIVRVHDVAATVRAVRVADAIRNGSPTT